MNWGWAFGTKSIALITWDSLLDSGGGFRYTKYNLSLLSNSQSCISWRYRHHPPNLIHHLTCSSILTTKNRSWGWFEFTWWIIRKSCTFPHYMLELPKGVSNLDGWGWIEVCQATDVHVACQSIEMPWAWCLQRTVVKSWGNLQAKSLHPEMTIVDWLGWWIHVWRIRLVNRQ